MLDVRSATDPDLIKWQNLGVSGNRRMCFGLLNFVITVLILVFTTYVVVYFNYFKQEVTESNPVLNTDDVITVEQA